MGPWPSKSQIAAAALPPDNDRAGLARQGTVTNVRERQTAAELLRASTAYKIGNQQADRLQGVGCQEGVSEATRANAADRGAMLRSFLRHDLAGHSRNNSPAPETPYPAALPWCPPRLRRFAAAPGGA
jgi:hypothetical protein